MTEAKKHLARKALGVLFVAVGFAALGADLHVVYLTQRAAHVTNLIIAGAMIFVGGLLLDPPTAESVADAIVRRLPAFSGLWPGGMRKEDPPAQPGVPLPPSVANVQPPHISERQLPPPPPPPPAWRDPGTR